MKKSQNIKRSKKAMKTKQSKNRLKNSRAEKARKPEYAMRERLIIKERQKEKKLKMKAEKANLKLQNKNNSKKSKIIKIVLAASGAAVILITALIVFFNLNREKEFSYSRDIDSNGFWKKITALDYVDLFEYDALVIPKKVQTVSRGDLQDALFKLFGENIPESKQVKDRAVVDGDSVNIDYIGSVDGVEFSGGNTGGAGTDVFAGSTNYIDDFLAQIIGHKPGETINVEVTFPEIYSNNPDLAGKEAVFVTTINYITEYSITDSFVEANLYNDNGWKTVKIMEEAKRKELEKEAIEKYISDYIRSKVPISSIPEKIMKYQEDALVHYYTGQAAESEYTYEEFLKNQVNVSNTEELLEKFKNENIQNSKYYLVIQAIAEDAEFTVSDKDMETYFSGYEEQVGTYGLPYLRQYVLGTKVLEFIKDNVVFEK